MNSKLVYSGIGVMSAGVVGILFAIVMEIATAEPVYYLVMKLTAGLFGVGGPLLGWGLTRKTRREK